MPNLSTHLPTHGSQQLPLSWLQSCDGEWHYFLDENNGDKAAITTVDQEYIWLVSPATSEHKIGGYRVANHRLEMFIKQLAGVSRVVVFGQPHEQKGNSIHVHVELSSPSIELSTLSGAINAKLASCLGDFACADVIKYVDQLPVTKSQETCRKILKSQNISMNCAA